MEPGADPAVPDRLTLDILAALAAGRPVAGVASSCNVSEATVRRRVRALKESWEAANTTVVVVRAVRLGLI